MTRREYLQYQLEFLNSLLSSAVIGGLIGLMLLIVQFFQSLNPRSFGVVIMAIAGFLIVGIYCVCRRKKFLHELEKMD